MRVGIYGRVNTKDKGQEVENQLREFAALQGWTIYREYIDHETARIYRVSPSGSVGSREDLVAKETWAGPPPNFRRP